MVHNDKTFANKVAETLQLHNSRKPDKKPETQHEEPPMLINTS